MPTDPNLPGLDRVPLGRAIRNHLAVVIGCLALGLAGGWLYLGTVPTEYTSTTRVLVNPSVGNPYTPTPASVRQDEQTSLETEAQVARSEEVLGQVAAAVTGLELPRLQSRLQITVPPNTQILEMSYTAGDPAVARAVADLVARAYLENRARRFEETTSARLERVETQTLSVVTDLRAATKGAQVGDAANRAFQSELAAALRNELVSLRAQRSALENSESPPGSVISPASTGVRADRLNTLVMPAGGGMLGLAAGFFLAFVLERLRGVVRSSSEVQARGLAVVGAVPQPDWLHRRLRTDNTVAVDATVRRLRAAILDLEARPDVVAVAPAEAGSSAAEVSEAIAASLARAGHRVVLVGGAADPAGGGLGVQEGLAQALAHERLDVMGLLEPSVEPLLSLLPHGQGTAESRERFAADRLRAVLDKLVAAGHLVVVQSPHVDSPEGEAVLGAADWGLVVVTLDRTRPRDVDRVIGLGRTTSAALAALVVGRRDSFRPRPRTPAEPDRDLDAPARPTKSAKPAVARDPRLVRTDHLPRRRP